MYAVLDISRDHAQEPWIGYTMNLRVLLMSDHDNKTYHMLLTTVVPVNGGDINLSVRKHNLNRTFRDIIPFVHIVQGACMSNGKGKHLLPP